MTLVAGIILALIFAWFLVAPHFLSEPDQSAERQNARQSLSDQHQRYLQMLRDLELDYSTKKLAQADYEQMKHSLMSELAEVLKKLEDSKA